MSNLFEIIVLGLAVWRIAYLIALEEGPFEIGTLIRKKIGVNHDLYVHELPSRSEVVDGSVVVHSSHFTTEEPSEVQPTWYLRGVTCVYCLSFWIGLLAALIISIDSHTIINGLAISTVAILVHAFAD